MDVQTETNPATHLAARLDSAWLVKEPFEHFFIDNVFPPDFYEMALASLPVDEAYTDRTFDNRAMVSVSDCGPFWKGVREWMFTSAPIMRRLRELLKLSDATLQVELRLIRDSAGYKIKPHTDIKAKAASCLFYLPDNDDHPELGTSIYTPKQTGFTSDGTKRYEFEEFNKVSTVPFVRNSLFGFARSDISFHGVEPIPFGPRNQLLLNIYRR